MDDQEVANRVGAVVLGLVLAALAWVLVFTSPRLTGGDDQLRVSGWQVLGAVSAHHHQPLHQLQRCIDAVAPGGVSWCVAASSGPSAPPTQSDRLAQQGSGPDVVGVTPPPTPVVAPSGPATPRPVTLQPSTPRPSTPRPPTPARRPLPHKGPVPGGTGGSTSPPHAGPRP
jgi:hypothetical protein